MGCETCHRRYHLSCGMERNASFLVHCEQSYSFCWSCTRNGEMVPYVELKKGEMAVLHGENDSSDEEEENEGERDDSDHDHDESTQEQGDDQGQDENDQEQGENNQDPDDMFECGEPRRSEEHRYVRPLSTACPVIDDENILDENILDENILDENILGDENNLEDASLQVVASDEACMILGESLPA